MGSGYRATRSPYGPVFTGVSAVGTAITGPGTFPTRMFFQGIEALAVAIALVLVWRRTRPRRRAGVGGAQPAGRHQRRERWAQRRARRARDPRRAPAGDRPPAHRGRSRPRSRGARQAPRGARARRARAVDLARTPGPARRGTNGGVRERRRGRGLPDRRHAARSKRSATPATSSAAAPCGPRCTTSSPTAGAPEPSRRFRRSRWGPSSRSRCCSRSRGRATPHRNRAPPVRARRSRSQGATCSRGTPPGVCLRSALGGRRHSPGSSRHRVRYCWWRTSSPTTRAREPTGSWSIASSPMSRPSRSSSRWSCWRSARSTSASAGSSRLRFARGRPGARPDRSSAAR